MFVCVCACACVCVRVSVSVIVLVVRFVRAPVLLVVCNFLGLGGFRVLCLGTWDDDLLPENIATQKCSTKTRTDSCIC